MEDRAPAVRLERVSKAFEHQKVLVEVSFQVGAGEAFCLLGRSGAGKSVTLKLMDGLLQPDEGHVFIEGIDLKGLKRDKLASVRKKTGFLFQSAGLFDSISVKENVAFPLRRHTQKSEKEIQAVVREKLKEVELEKDGDKMPAELSGGMRKRAGLARALALDPRILLVDEPRSGLDPITAAEIYNLLAGLKQKRKVTLVIVTHDVTHVRRFADRLAVLHEGKILACGTAEELDHSDNPLVHHLVSGSEK